MAAQDFAEQVINQALTIAQSKADSADNYADDAVTAASGWATLSPPSVNFTPGQVEPNVTIPSTATGLDSALYDATVAQIINDLSSQFAGFFTTYFPANDAAMSAAQAWLTKALTTGGTGLSAAVEAQIVDRDRSRVQREAQRAMETTLAAFAARGYPVPPGAAVHALTQANQQSAELVGQSSRETAIRQMELEVQNVRFAVEQTLNYRTQAISAAADYIRTLSLGPEIAARLATSSADAQARLIGAANGFFNSRIRLEELKLDVVKTNAGLTIDAGKTNVNALMESIRNKSNAVVSVATSLGSQAAAALNALHSQVGIMVQEEAE